MRLLLLGAMEAWDGDVRLDLGGPKPRLILALLAKEAGGIVPTPKLVDAVWGDDPPADPRATLQVNISSLRKTGDGLPITHRSPGYVLELDPSAIDRHRFEALVAEGVRLVPSHPRRGATLLRDALSLWRGRPYGDLADESALVADVRGLEEQRLRALEKRIGADLALGDHERLHQELETLVQSHPLREPFWGQLALVQYRTGQPAESLRTLERARRLLAEELGSDPSPALKDLHARILRQDPGLAAPSLRSDRDAEPLRTVRGYALLEELGTTPAGATRYRARQPGTGRPVDVREFDTDAIGLPVGDLARRIERAQRLDHRHLPDVLDHWTDDGHVYLVTQTVEGDPLSDTLQRGPWTPDRAVSLVDDLAAAVDHALGHGAWLGSLGTDGVTLAEDDRPVIAGYADALVTEEGASHDPAAQAVGDLGRLGYRLLTGARVPVPAGDDHVAPPDLRDLRPDLPPAAGRVLERAVRRPDGRFPTAGAFAAAFRGAVTGTEPDLLAAEIRNPYKGLRAFGEADADDFFGRSRLAEKLLDRLERDRVIALVGPSGSGKSSVVRAGLLPALRDTPGNWRIATMTPGEWPMAELEHTLEELAPDRGDDLGASLAADGGLADVAEELSAPGGSLLLVVDQFEELFALAPAPDRAAFLEQLAAALSRPGGPLHVVMTLRADFYDQLLLDPAMGSVVAERTVPVTPLTPDELEHAITGPAEAVGLRVEPELTAQLVADVVDAPGSLPSLQYALTELCDERSGDTLRLDDFRELGGLHGALAGRAETLYGQLDEEGREVCRQVFLRLVVVTEQVAETRRRVLRPELLDLGDEETVEQVLELFGSHRLLTFDHDPFTRVPTVEVAHEALMHAWGRLRGWIDAARDDLVMHRRLLAAADEWRRSDEEPSYLLVGSRLDAVEDWAATTSVMLTRSQRDYLERSVEARDRREREEQERRERERMLERRSLRRMRGLVAVLVLGLAAAGVLAWLALEQRSTADEQRQLAETQRAAAEEQGRVATARELAAESLTQLDVDPERSLLLAIEAVETTRRVDGTVLPEAESALHQAVRLSRVESVLNVGAGVALGPQGELAVVGMDGEMRVLDAAGELLWERSDRATGPLMLPGESAPRVFLGRTPGADVHPETAIVASTTADFTVELRELATGEIVTTLDGDAARPRFSPDGRYVAAIMAQEGTDRLWDAARTIGLWDADTGELVRRFEGHEFGVNSHAFSPDGTRLATASGAGGRIGLWDVDTGEQLVMQDRSGAKAVAFSPDGTLLAVGSGDGLVEIRDAGTLEVRETFHGHEGDIFAVAFSPDGSRVAVGGTGVELFDPATGEELMALPGHTATVAAVAFSRDAETLVTSAEDGTTRRWDIAAPGGREIATLPGPQPPARGAVDAGPDGKLIATTGPDGVRLHRVGSWEVVRTLPLGPAAAVDVTFSPDGGRLAAGLLPLPPGPGSTGTLVVWDVETGQRVLEVGGHAPFITDQAWSADGRLIATGTDNEGLARVIDVASGEIVSTYDFTEGSIVAVEFTPDGLFVGGQDAGYVIDPETGEELRTFEEADETLIDDRLTADGTLVTSDIEGRIDEWDPATGQRLRRITDYPGGIFAVGLGDGIVASVTPPAVSIVDFVTGEPRFDLVTGHDGGASDLAFTPDGRYLVTGGIDGTIRLFAMDVDELLALAHERATRSLTTAECRRFLHTETCPAG